MERLQLNDGDSVTLALTPPGRADGVPARQKRILAGGTPGPMLMVRQGGRASIQVEGDHVGTLHWHGLEASGTGAGAPGRGVARHPVQVRFRAPGAFLYHTRFGRGDPASTEPHGVVLVVPRQADYWAPVDRQRLLLFAGRTPVVNGRNDLILASRSTHVERLYLVNAAPRILSLRLPGTTMKLVGADRGRLEREAFVESVLLAPFERAVVEVLFPHAGHFRLEHRRPGSSVVLCSFHVRSGTGRGAGRPADFERLRDAPEFDDLRRELPSLLAREPALVLAVADAPSAVVPQEAGRERTGWKVRLVHAPSDGRGHRLVHVEGGRFLVLARDGLPTPTLAGKDTLLLRVGEVVDVLLVPFGTSPATLHLIDADGLERYRSVSIVDGAGIAPGPGGRSGR